NAAGNRIARNKFLTNRLLSKFSIPVPKQTILRKEKSIDKIIEKVGLPMVLKPKSQSCGLDVFVNIETKSEVEKISHYLLSKYKVNLAESFETGSDHRVFVYKGKIIGFVKREPPYVIGDGEKTLGQLTSEISRFVYDQHYEDVKKSLGVEDSSIIPKDKKLVL